VPSSPFHGYRFPAEIITHAVWLYHRHTRRRRQRCGELCGQISGGMTEGLVGRAIGTDSMATASCAAQAAPRHGGQKELSTARVSATTLKQRPLRQAFVDSPRNSEPCLM
jgi:hypothetical protein